MLWFHEYDDLDVEVGELGGREWGVKEEGREGEEEWEEEVKMEDVKVGATLKVEDAKVKMMKVEDVDMDVKTEDVNVDG